MIHTIDKQQTEYIPFEAAFAYKDAPAGSHILYDMDDTPDATLAYETSSWTVYDWMEDPRGLGLTDLYESKIYAMVYAHHRNFRGSFPINQSALARAAHMSRKKVNEVLDSLMSRGLISSSKCYYVLDNGSKIQTCNTYKLSQRSVNFAFARLASARIGDPLPAGEDGSSVMHNGQNGQFPLGGTGRGFPQCAAQPGVTGSYSGAPNGVENPRVIHNSGVSAAHPGVTGSYSGDTCGNDMHNGVSPVGPGVTASYTPGHVRPTVTAGATCENAETTNTDAHASTCGSVNKTAGFEIERPININKDNDKDKEFNSLSSLPVGDRAYHAVCCSDEAVPVEAYPEASSPADSRPKEKDDEACGGKGRVPAMASTVEQAAGKYGMTATEADALSRMIRISGKRGGVKGRFLDKTAAAFAKRLRSGVSAEEILIAWNGYLEDVHARNADREDPVKFEAYPLNWLEAPSGFVRWVDRVSAASGGPRYAERSAAARRKAASRDRLSPDCPISLLRTVEGWYVVSESGDTLPLGLPLSEASEEEALAAARDLLDVKREERGHAKKRALERAGSANMIDRKTFEAMIGGNR